MFEESYFAGKFRVWSFNKKKLQALLLTTEDAVEATNKVVEASEKGYAYATIQDRRGVRFFTNANQGKIIPQDLRPILKKALS